MMNEPVEWCSCGEAFQNWAVHLGRITQKIQFSHIHAGPCILWLVTDRRGLGGVTNHVLYLAKPSENVYELLYQGDSIFEAIRMAEAIWRVITV